MGCTQYILILSRICVFSLTCLFATSNISVANTSPKMQDFPNNTQGEPPDFTGDGRPDTGSAGDSRGDCPEADGQFVALLPDSNYGETIKEQPRLWFYVPYTSEQVVRGEFSLQDESGIDINERIAFSLPNEAPGFVSIILPDTLSLENPGIDYQWYLELYCTPNSSPLAEFGWIQRVPNSAEIEAQLEQENIPEDVVFTEQLIWFDALDSLARLRIEEPENPELRQRWEILMNAKGVSLTELPDAPFWGDVVPLE